MPMRQVIVGTSEEIATALQSSAFAGRRVRAIIEPDEQDLSIDLPDPKNTVRSEAELEQRLLDGLASPVREMTDSGWQELRRRAGERINSKTP